MNPRLYQAMDLLYLPLLELEQHLKQELVQNPFLEMREPEEEFAEQAETEEQAEEEEEVDWEEILLDGFDPGYRTGPTRERPEEVVEKVGESTIDLWDHLQAQLYQNNGYEDGDMRIGGGDHRKHRRGRLSDLLGGRGRLDDRREGRRTSTGCSTASSTSIRLGVGARDLRECLLLQVEEAGPRHPFRIASSSNTSTSCPLTSITRSPALRHQSSGSSEGRRRDREARSQARPQVRPRSDDYITPDLIVDKIDGKYHVYAQRREPAAPRISRKAYQELARQEEVQGQEQGVRPGQAERRELDDPGDRAAPADDAQGDELHRRPAARVLREGHSLPAAAHAPGGRRGNQNARVHGEPCDEREIRADPARRASGSSSSSRAA